MKIVMLETLDKKGIMKIILYKRPIKMNSCFQKRTEKNNFAVYSGDKSLRKEKASLYSYIYEKTKTIRFQKVEILIINVQSTKSDIIPEKYHELVDIIQEKYLLWDAYKCQFNLFNGDKIGK